MKTICKECANCIDEDKCKLHPIESFSPIYGYSTSYEWGGIWNFGYCKDFKKSNFVRSARIIIAVMTIVVITIILIFN